MISKFISMYFWIKNKKNLEIENQKQDEQYHKCLIEIKDLKNTIKKLECEYAKEKRMKQLYLSRCKSLSKRLLEDKTE